MKNHDDFNNIKETDGRAAARKKTHLPTSSDLNPDGLPKNSTPSDIRFCVDSRKGRCPYSYRILYKNEYIALDRFICLYQYRHNPDLCE